MAFALLLCSLLAAAPDRNDPRQRVLSALVEELSRSQKDLRLRGHEAPYFLSYAVRGIQAREVGAKYGAIFLDHVRRERRLQVDVRVGSYQFDNTGSQEMFDFDGQDSGYSAGRHAAGGQRRLLRRHRGRAAARRETVAEDRRDDRRAARAVRRPRPRSVHGPGAALARGSWRALPRSRRAPPGGRTAERRQGR